MEIWKAVVGFEGEYEISDHGNVRSIDRWRVYRRRDQYSGRILTVRRFMRGCQLRPAPNSGGHLTVLLGRRKTKLVHILVLEAFVGPCPAGFVGCHFDDVPTNNLLVNLRWDTRTANLHDAIRNGRRRIGGSTHQAKLLETDIPVIRELFGKISIAAIGRQYGVNESTIRQIRDRKAWKHVGEIACA